MRQKTPIILIILLFHHFHTNGQNPITSLGSTLDTLQYKLTTADSDTLKVDLLIEMSRQKVKEFDHIMAKELADKAYSISHAKDFKAGMGKALIQMAYVYWFLEDFDSSLDLDLQALEINKEYGDSLTLAYNYKRLTHDYCDLFIYDNALIQIQKAIDIHEAKNQLNDLVVDKALMGYIYMHQEKYDKAEEIFLETLAYAKTIDRPSFVAGISDDLAYLFELQGKLDEGLKYALQGLSVSTKHDIKRHMREGYIILEKIYVGLKDYEKAYETKLKKDDLEFETMTLETLTKFNELNKEKEILVLEQQNQLGAQERELLKSKGRNYQIGAIGLISSLFILGISTLRLRKGKLQIEQKNEELQSLNNTKDKFFGIIGHDLRSPINALDSVGEQIEYYVDKEDTIKLKRIAKDVKSTTGKLSRLLDNLLQWALSQSGNIPFNPDVQDIHLVVNDCINLYHPVAQLKNITMANNCSKGSNFYGDKQAITTIVRNLLNNAVKFTPENGSIIASSYTENEFQVLEIKDTGVGMSEEKIKQLFSLKNVGTQGTAGEQSTGLGLVVCKELMESNNGKIVVSSEVSKGSTFKIYIPKNS